ncbi:SDR family oxidoreductase [uncultured Zhongshania sp.]|jgi:short-subunit dehydrogenase|uniref:SDR family oxidoreductase n=1 Tax=uncultured Zhongshania sp. TaxID=1642288 RepID=UPI0030DDCCB8|tara:strand:- start:2996 stop:3787 length:792 start_codon:yes stop_codon:yes gene_type:complete
MTTLTIVLTGACGGIGRALAVAFASAGHNLVLIGRNPDALAALREGLERPRSHRYIVADLSSAEAITELCSDIADGSAIDVLVNNAGTSSFGVFAETDDAVVEHMFQLNVLAPMRLCKGLMPLLLKSRNAAVINVGSGFGSIGFAGFTAYCASKFGLRGFTEALQRELANENIAIHYLAPRAVNTALNSDKVVAMNAELGNAADEPEVVAAAALAMLQLNKSSNRYLGWPERFFVRLNALFPSIVSGALKKQLATILRYAKSA